MTLSTLPVPNSTSSFWHRDPSKILLGHRTTPALPTTTDVVVVGSGISGAFAAHFLSQSDQGKKLDIVMLEAREACWGATGRNGGHCQPAIYSSPAEIGSFETRNFQYLKTLIAENNIPCEWKSVEGCHAYYDKTMFNNSLAHLKTLTDIAPGLASSVRVITKDSTQPSLSSLRISNAVGAFLQANAASLWPYKLVAWVLEKLLSNNEEAKAGSFNLQTDTPVTSLQKVENDGSWIVHTPRGMIAAKHVILATNAYTSHLLPKMQDLIVPVQGEMSALIPPSSVQSAPLGRTYVFAGHDDGKDIYQDDYLIQRPFSKNSSTSGGELMFGGGRQYGAGAGVGVSDDSYISGSAAKYLRNALNNTLKLDNGGIELKVSHEWSGIMGFSRDGRPWVGEVSEDLGLGGGKGLWLCAGFTGHGMPNAVLSAKAVVKMISENKADVPDEYRVTKERIIKARQGDEVSIADMKGFFV